MCTNINYYALKLQSLSNILGETSDLLSLVYDHINTTVNGDVGSMGYFLQRASIQLTHVTAFDISQL